MKTLKIKIHNFLYACAIGAVQPLYPLIAKSLGVPSSMFGSIMTTVAFLTLPLCPVIGWVTNKMQKLKLVLIVLIIGQTPCYLLINYLPPMPIGLLKEQWDEVLHIIGRNNSLVSSSSLGNNSINYSSVWNKSSVQRMLEFSKQEFRNYTGTSLLVDIFKYAPNAKETFYGNFTNSFFSSEEVNLDNLMLTYQFWLLLTFTCLAFITTNVVQSLSNAACCKILEGHCQEFGKLKLWDSLGLGLLALVAGYLLYVTNLVNSGKTDYSVCFYLMIPFIVADVITLKMLPLSEITSSHLLLRDIAVIFTKPHPFIFTSAVFFIGLFHGLKLYYSYWFMEEMDLSKWQLGLLMAIKCAGEALSFNFAGQMTKRIGRDNIMCIFLLCFASWYLTICFIPDFILILFVCLIEGICYGVFYTSMCTYASIIASTGTEVAMQTILGATFYGFGMGTGSLLGGIGFQNFGGNTTFQYCGFSAISIALLYKGVTIFVADQTSFTTDNNTKNINKLKRFVTSEDGSKRKP